MNEFMSQDDKRGCAEARRHDGVAETYHGFRPAIHLPGSIKVECLGAGSSPSSIERCIWIVLRVGRRPHAAELQITTLDVLDFHRQDDDHGGNPELQGPCFFAVRVARRYCYWSRQLDLIEQDVPTRKTSDLLQALPDVQGKCFPSWHGPGHLYADPIKTGKLKLIDQSHLFRSFCIAVTNERVVRIEATRHGFRPVPGCGMVLRPMVGSDDCRTISCSRCRATDVAVGLQT